MRNVKSWGICVGFLLTSLASLEVQAQQELAREGFQGEIEPGTALVFQVTPDPEAAGLRVEPPEATRLTEEGRTFSFLGTD